MKDNSKESDDSSKCDKLALPSSPKGEIVGIMIQVLSLMATHSEVGTGAQRLVQVMAT